MLSKLCSIWRNVLVMAMLPISLAITGQHSLGSGLAVQSQEQTLEREWDRELEGTHGKTEDRNPVNRVVGLLRKMAEELEKEKDNDLKVYEDLKCWCETNSKETKKKIKYDTTCIRERTDEIEERSSNHGVYEAQMPQMEKEIKEIQKSLLEAENIRSEEAEKYHLSAQDLSQTIINAKNAITILAKHSAPGASFMQAGSPLLSSIQAVLRDLALKHELLAAKGKPAGANAGDTLLLSLKSRRSRMTNVAETNKGFRMQNDILADALDVSGHSVPGVLPVNFAQQELAKSANDVAKGNFLQTKSKQPNTYQSYASQSGTVLGILQQMLDDFEKEMSDTTAAEDKAKANYKEMVAARYAELKALQDKLYQMKVAHARNLKKISDAKMYLKQCYTAQGEDEGFMRHLRDTCEGLDRKWQVRSATRSKEITAVAETIHILTEDGARSTLYNAQQSTSLLQLTSMEMQRRRSNTIAFLQKLLRDPLFDSGDLLSEWENRKGVNHRTSGHVSNDQGPRSQLSTLVVHVQKDSFTKIKVVMDRMIANLKTRQADEVKFKASCIKDFNENSKSTYEKNEEKEDLEIDTADLNKQIKQASDAIEDAKARIADAVLESKKASQAREEENSAYQSMMAGQHATQEILTKALKRLKQFYTDAEGGDGKALVQVASQTKKQPTPKQFMPYKTHKNASPVVGLIEQIIEDSKKLTAEATSDEASAQADYEKTVKAYNDEIEVMNGKIMASKELKAQASWEAANKQSTLNSAKEELDSLSKYEADLHSKCDFVLKNFDARQKARSAEIEGIQGAKANLDGGRVVLSKD